MSSTSPHYLFEPLADHDRASFFCGVPELDEYLHLRASQGAKRKVAAPFVMVNEARQFLGYYTLSAYGLRLAELPSDTAKRLKYPLIPPTLLGRLAVRGDHQGQKLGRDCSWMPFTGVGRIQRKSLRSGSLRRRSMMQHEDFICTMSSFPSPTIPENYSSP